MRLSTHLWTSALAGLVCYPRLPGRAMLLTLAGVLIDLDHWVVYCLQTGDYSLGGALIYDRYRNTPARVGDTRPRYGTLRSWLHQPAVLPPLVLAARHWSPLRPVAIAVALHLLLDYHFVPLSLRVTLRAKGRCQLCGSSGRNLRPHPIKHPLEGGKLTLANHVALCKQCEKRADASYPLYPPPEATG